MIEKMDFADGKYTVVNDNGKMMALRYNEPWNRDLTGDNLIHSMFHEALRLKQERDAMEKALRWIARVNAMDYEYQRIARAAIDTIDTPGKV